jgi:L-lactate dehydrogenase
VQRSGLPWQRVLGLGTQLDTARFRGYLGKALGVPASQVNAIILGEHGDSMVPVWSSATVNGLPLESWPGFSQAVGQQAFEETKTAGATVIKLKAGSSMAVGHSIREVVEALARDSRQVLPVSTLLNGEYGLRDVCLSVPTVVGCGGVRQQIELELTPKEKMGIQNSGRVLREIIDQVEGRIGGKTIGNRAGPKGRVIPRAAWAGSKAN